MKVKTTIEFEIDPEEDVLIEWQMRLYDFMCDFPQVCSHEVKVEEN